MANYKLLEQMNEKQLRKFIQYMNDALYRVRKFEWQTHMKDLWTEGKEKADALLVALESKKQAV